MSHPTTIPLPTWRSAPSLPPLHLAPARPRRSALALENARLGRLVLCLAALALPALGIAAADTVHRVGAPGATQAAALSPPPLRAAAPDDDRRATLPVRAASLRPDEAGVRP